MHLFFIVLRIFLENIESRIYANTGDSFLGEGKQEVMRLPYLATLIADAVDYFVL